MITTPRQSRLERDRNAFRHELYPYAGEDQFLSGTLGFVREALERNEAVVVAVPRARETLLRSELPASGSVTFVDAAAPGRNPGRLIAAWQSWIGALTEAGRTVRGIGETAWREARTSSEVAELRYHEWLLNLAFAHSPAWWLLCPYDTDGTDPAALSSLSRCHPLIRRDGRPVSSEDWVPDEPFAFEDLGDPCGPLQALDYTHGDLAAVRKKITRCAEDHGLTGRRLSELAVAATEIASNSIRHADGHGTLRTWAQDGTLVCEFRDTGHIDDPLAGRIRPARDQLGGRGLWLVHQLCDLVEVRSAPLTGTTVRLHMELP